MDEQIDINNQEGNKNNPSPYLIPGAIMAAGVLIAGALLYGNGSLPRIPTPNPAGSAAAGSAAQKPLQNLEDDGPILGNPKAKVTVVEFGDFQCPFCGRFFNTTERQIIEKYVKTGKVRFVYRDFAFLGQESEWSAEAAKCAKEQGKFWQYHDYLFAHQKGENQGAFSKENLKRFGKELGLNSSQFNSCLDSDKSLLEVRKDTEDGRNAGVGGTPTNFVNGRIVTGAVPFVQFEQIIEEELKK